MSLGGSSGATTTNNIPQWVQDAGQSTYQNVAVPASQQPYTPYTGEQVAPINATQQSAFDMAGQNANLGQGAIAQGIGAAQQGVNTAQSAQGFTGQASQYAGQSNDIAALAAMKAAGYTPQQVGTSYNQSAVNAQLNPYTQNVIDTTNSDLQRQNQIANTNNDASATQVGAYGGTRNAVQDALTNEGYARAMATNTANLNQANYTNAQQQALAQQQLQQSAQTSNQGAGLTAAMTGAQIANQSAGIFSGNAGIANQSGSVANQSAGVQNQSAGVLGLLGTQQQGVATQGYNNLLNAGNVQQQQQQNVDNVGINQYQTAQNWPLRQLSILEGAINQTPYATSTTQQGSSNPIGGALGGAAAGAAVGSAIPGVGTAIGAGVGGLLGLFK
jgi:hypothetical protein